MTVEQCLRLLPCAAARSSPPPTRDTPVCPQFQNMALEKYLSRISPAGKIEGIRMAHRRVAAAQGYFDHYSPSDKAKPLQGKKNI